jgi:uncharacterized membrane protein
MDSDRAFWAVLLIWILGALVTLAVWGAVIFIALHFVLKYW